MINGRFLNNRMPELATYEGKVRYFELYERSKIKKDSCVLVIASNTMVGDDPYATISDELKECRRFVQYLRRNTTADILCTLKTHNEVTKHVGSKEVDVIIDMHELHTRQVDYILDKLGKSRSDMINLFP